MPTIKWVNYQLVLLDTFSGWVEAFLTTNKRNQTILSLLLWEIIPHLGILVSHQSDNVSQFTSQISQTLSKALTIPWYFHIPYHFQPNFLDIFVKL